MKIVRLRYDSYNKTILLGTAAICVKTKTVVDAEMTVPGASLVPRHYCVYAIR
jgi:hypothetical protein